MSIDSASLKYAPKITTWIQVTFAIVASIVQIVQIAVNPQAQLFGTVSVLALVTLALVIIICDYKSNETGIRMREAVSWRNGAIDVLTEAERNFRQEARAAKRPNVGSAYLTAANLVRRYRHILENTLKQVAERT